MPESPKANELIGRIEAYFTIVRQEEPFADQLDDFFGIEEEWEEEETPRQLTRDEIREAIRALADDEEEKETQILEISPKEFRKALRQTYEESEEAEEEETAGIKYDSKKIRMELFPGDSLRGTAEVLTHGASKYTTEKKSGSRNWEAGINYSRVFGSLQRHLWAWFHGEQLDPESSLHHLHHSACCLMFLQSYECRMMTEFDDRPCNDFHIGEMELTSDMEDHYETLHNALRRFHPAS